MQYKLVGNTMPVVEVMFDAPGEPEKDFEPGGNCVVHNRLESLSL